MMKVPQPVFTRPIFKTASACLFTLAVSSGCSKPNAVAPVEVNIVETSQEEKKQRTEPESPTAPKANPVPKAEEPKAVQPRVKETEQTEPVKQPGETPPVASKPFAFPADKGGKLLEGVLPPKSAVMKTDRVELTPRERTLPEFLNSSVIVQPDAADAPVTLPLPPRRVFQPTTLPEKIITDFAANTPSLPPVPMPEIGSLHKQPTRDPAQPADLPILANKPVIDRAPLEDPTVEFTAQSVVSLLLPLREAMAPFMKLTIPEPFEGAGQAVPKQVPVEDPNKVLTPPPAPKP